jgi:gamma-glutamylcyclotransferase (GGCT)/AIG2-like uncharacterized protein YtfP
LKIYTEAKKGIEKSMAIANAVQKGSWIYVYDEKGRKLTTISGDVLHGFTSSTVSVKKGSWIYVYDEKGHKLSTTSAK